MISGYYGGYLYFVWIDEIKSNKMIKICKNNETITALKV
jgi:hypothetical protein